MGDVVNILKNTLHTTGPTRCRECGHEDVSTCPVGVYKDMECSSCHHRTSDYVGEIGPAVGRKTWACDNCSGEKFWIEPGPTFHCCRCGIKQEGILDERIV